MRSQRIRDSEFSLLEFLGATINELLLFCFVFVFSFFLNGI